MYQASDRLPAERASKLGHLDVLKSDMVRNLIHAFETKVHGNPAADMPWDVIKTDDRPLTRVFAVDGSLSTIESGGRPNRALSFVKAALIRLDQPALEKIDSQHPHPLALRDIVRQGSLHHATVLPLQGIVMHGRNLYDSVRAIIFESLKDDSLKGELFETLKWLIYEKWNPNQQRNTTLFGCPSCPEGAPSSAYLQYDTDKGLCPGCGAPLFLTDWLGFHQNMSEDAASGTIATDYMTIAETLLLVTAIRKMWQANVNLLGECLFIKDGPLSLRAQFSKLVVKIRAMLVYANDVLKSPICILGQEKTGYFVDYLNMLGPDAPTGHFFVPGHDFIRTQIQHLPVTGAPYGQDTNYGAKVLYVADSWYRTVLNVPTGDYVKAPSAANLIGLSRILATLPKLRSTRFQGALVPVELANNLASLSTYPSGRILRVFAQELLEA